MQKEDTLTAGPNDLRALWRQLFLQRVFKADLERHQYWIIDALDEANRSHELLSLLKNLPQGYSVFFTSRKNRDLERELRRLDLKIPRYNVEKEDTLRDIRGYIEYNGQDLRVDSDAERQRLIQRLVDLSNGSFLWTHLIVQELVHCYTDEDTEAVLMEVPSGMHDSYTRILRKISRDVNKRLARAILQWVICATRPMYVSELSTAFRLDTSNSLKQTAQAIEEICGPLVSVNNNRVEVVHETVREHLFSKDREIRHDADPHFLFDKGSTHERLAYICVSFLIKSLRARSRSNANSDSEEDPFLQYASKNFSEHVFRSAAAEESDQTRDLVRTLSEFFQGPVLFWIQRQAEERSLSMLTLAGKNLKQFVTKRTNLQTGLRHLLKGLEGWANDLIHIATVFGQDLLQKPIAIHIVIPPLCPTLSRIYREIGNRGIGMQVVGLSDRPWSDRISSASYGRDYANALACCERFYAVALRSAEIVLYYKTTCQEARRIEAREPVRILEFGRSKDWLAASGRRTLTVYNYETGDDIWTLHTSSEALSLTMTANDSEIIVVTREKHVETFSIQRAARIDSRDLKETNTPGRSPQQVHLSEELGLLALIHRNEELELYDLQSLRRSTGRIRYSVKIDTIAFNPNPVFNMLAMATFDGELCTIELSFMRKVQKAVAYVAHLAISMDGKTLLAGCKNGDIQIYNFENLDLLFNLRRSDEEIMGLCFTHNSYRFLDIRRQAFNVWEPAALVRHNDDIDSSGSDGLSTFASALSHGSETTSRSGHSAIDAFVEHHSGDHVFCARENGDIDVYHTAQGHLVQQLFNIGRTIVLFMAWNKTEDLLATGDNSSTIRVHHIWMVQERHARGFKYVWQFKERWSVTLQEPIRQVLFSLDGDLLLVSTSANEQIFSSQGGPALLTHECRHPQTPEQPSQRWASYVRKKRPFQEVQHGESHKISWDKNGVRLPVVEPVQLSECLYSERDRAGHKVHLVQISAQVWAAFDNNPTSGPLVWSHAEVSATTSESFKEHFHSVAATMTNLLGIFRARLVFLRSDNWICSMRIDGIAMEEPISSHFPLPHCWMNPSRPLVASVTSKGDIVFAVGGDLAIVKNALQV